MKTRTTKRLLFYAFSLCLWGLPRTTAAQGGLFPPPGGSEEPGDGTIGTNPDVTPVPVDGGLIFLLAVGAGYGIKKYRSVRLLEDEKAQFPSGGET